ncbi:unnamed protein product [Porites evermanni]|uniref:Uncharacterized protein n=1 Tax=Porites evermanni TaxID=104178 RepID=A0ABN8SZL5_9CNID|nr:unnamed protein product [Porites evermanni]
MAEPSNSNNIAENESGQLGGCKGGAPPNANPNLSPVALKTLISCFPDQKLQSVSAPSQGVSALQPSQSPSPSMACQQQLMNPSIITSLLLPLLGMSSSQVQQPSSLTAHVPQKTKWSITRCEFVEFDSLDNPISTLQAHRYLVSKYMSPFCLLASDALPPPCCPIPKFLTKLSHLPITVSILHQIHLVLQPSRCVNTDSSMLWAAFTVAFLCSLHSSELTCGGTFDAQIHLTRLEVSFYPDLLQPDYFEIVIKKSKTDPFWATAKLTIAKSNSPVCAVTASRDYFQTRTHSAAQPLFQFSDGQYLTRSSFTHNFRPC